jgi:DNA-binding transcriptional LysR family regulator
MDTKQLKTFRTIAKNLSFSKTAEELNFAQSTVSAQIRSLENELQLTLFDRLGKKVVLTNEGESVLQYANRFREIEDQFITSLKNKDEVRGELNIFAPNTICVYHLPQLLTEFRNKHSQVTFKLRAHLGTTKALEELRSGNLDLVIVMEEEFDDPDLNITVLRAEEIIFICNNNHPLADRVNLELSDLKDENFILTEPTCGYRSIITREFLKLGIKLNPVMWFDNAEAIKECVNSNMGISFIPKITAEQGIAEGKFQQINLVRKFDNQIKLQLITHKDKWLSPALDEFINALKNKISSE